MTDQNKTENVLGNAAAAAKGKTGNNYAGSTVADAGYGTVILFPGRDKTLTGGATADKGGVSTEDSVYSQYNMDIPPCQQGYKEVPCKPGCPHFDSDSRCCK